MKRQKIRSVLIILITVVLFVSCSEDQTTAPPTSNTPLAKFSDIKSKSIC